MDRLTELATFITVVDQGGFAAASRYLRRSPPTITRIVADLEARVGVKLLERTSRRCTPTEAGRRLAEHARNLIADYEQAVSVATGESVAPRGLVRLTAPYFFGREHVAPAVMRFVDTHDGMFAELDLSDRPQDLVLAGFDLAVRIGPISDKTLKVRRIGFVRQVIVASPEYLARRGEPATPEALRKHDLVQHGSQFDAPWRLQGPTGEVTVRMLPRFTVNQADAALAAARAGRGLVTALSYQVNDDLAAGKLVCVLESFEPDPLPVQLIWPDGRDRLRRVRMMIDHLVKELQGLDVLRSR